MSVIVSLPLKESTLDGSGAGDGVKEFWTETARQAKTQWWENLRLI